MAISWIKIEQAENGFIVDWEDYGMHKKVVEGEINNLIHFIGGLFHVKTITDNK